MVADEEPRRAVVTFPAAGHLYDARRGGYLGHARTSTTTVLPSIAHVYAMLPYRLTGLQVSVSGKGVVAAGESVECVIRAQVEGPAPGLQVWLVEVRGPDGTIREAFTRRIVARGGEAIVRIPLALGDAPAGSVHGNAAVEHAATRKWEVSVRDAATGVTGKGSFEVKATSQGNRAP